MLSIIDSIAQDASKLNVNDDEVVAWAAPLRVQCQKASSTVGKLLQMENAHSVKPIE